MTYQEALKTNWILDGQVIVANYCGFKVAGMVKSSRPKYGTEMQYSIALAEPVLIFGMVRNSLLIDDKDILEVL
jgi:hypothetical protein